MERKVANVTEPWKAWPGAGMTRYTRFFSAVAAGINITYISPFACSRDFLSWHLQPQHSCSLWFPHTPKSMIPAFSSTSSSYIHWHQRARWKDNILFTSMSGIDIMYKHKDTELYWHFSGVKSSSFTTNGCKLFCHLFFLYRSSLSMFMSCWRLGATWLK